MSAQDDPHAEIMRLRVGLANVQMLLAIALEKMERRECEGETPDDMEHVECLIETAIQASAALMRTD